jgi:hypothetical protein
MENIESACIFTLPKVFCDSLCQEYFQEINKLSTETQIIIDFKHIKKIDYELVNTLLYFRQCFANCLNHIEFINYSNDVKALLQEVDLNRLLGLKTISH